ncbi:MAG: hypothetical protein R3A10_10865 [Caldilineaceae bacterium]
MNEHNPQQGTSGRRHRVLFIAPTSFFADYGCHVRILEEARVAKPGPPRDHRHVPQRPRPARVDHRAHVAHSLAARLRGRFQSPQDRV